MPFNRNSKQQLKKTYTIYKYPDIKQKQLQIHEVKINQKNVKITQ